MWSIRYAPVIEPEIDIHSPAKAEAGRCIKDLGGLSGHSHSMVPGGLLVTSSVTRLTSGTSLVIRVEMRSSTS